MKTNGVCKISTVMTAVPITVNADDEVETAQDYFERYGIHHLPVLSAGKVVGLLSKHDIDLVASQYSKIGARTALHVQDVLKSVPCLVNPDATLAEVSRMMAEGRHSAAVIVDGLKVRGIFTVTDACRWICNQFPAVSAS